MNGEETSQPVEGEGDGRGIGAYPLDSLLIRTDQRTVHDVLRRAEKGFFILDPEFQRDFVWEPYRQSRLIESILMRIPLPVFYLAENPDGKLVVVDGLQRLSTLRRFVSGELKLTLENNAELDGRTFQTLPPKLQNRVEDAQLTLYIVDAKVPERVRLDIFERVNSGKPLTRQQMRNALYQGPATAFLKREASSGPFLNATAQALNRGEMRDREAVNRFVAFRLLGWRSYAGDMDEFLANGLRRLNESAEDARVALAASFQSSMRANLTVFGKHAFRKHDAEQVSRKVLNLSLFDVFSVGFSLYPEDALVARTETLKEMFFELMLNEDFVRDITYATSNKEQVQGRFEAVETRLAEVMG